MGRGNIGHVVSIHAPLTGGDKTMLKSSTNCLFQSTPPSREATLGGRGEDQARGVSIHAPLTGGDPVYAWHQPDQPVSIHAPLTGGDAEARKAFVATARVSIHAPLTGGDPFSPHRNDRQFVSIHAPLTGGDVVFPPLGIGGGCFNPRPPHGRRHVYHVTGIQPDGFNPRPPHGRRPASVFRSCGLR